MLDWRTLKLSKLSKLGMQTRTLLPPVLMLVLTIWCPGATPSPVSDAFFQLGCGDDFSFVRSIGTDCQQYMMCHSGVVLSGTCPQGYIFNDFSLRCQLPSQEEKLRCSRLRLNNMPMTCLWRPRARLPSYVSCAQYFDCAARSSSPGALPDYVTECPYPQLFSTRTGKCEHHSKVRCTGRTEPKAPCDYIQYRELCQGPNCGRCENRHPSCVGHLDGNHPVPPSATMFFVCQSERTINIGRCSSGRIFSNATRKCEHVMSSSQSFPSFDSSPLSNGSKGTPPSLTQTEVRALFERLRNPGPTPDKGGLAPKVVRNNNKNTIALTGAATLWLGLNSKNSGGKDNGGKSLPVTSPIEGIMGSLRDGLVSYSAGADKGQNSYGGANVYSVKHLDNPYSKIA